MNISDRLGIGALGVALIIGVSACKGPASEPAATSDITVTRQANFKKLGAANKAIGDELKKDAPDIAVARAQAPVIAGLAPQVVDWFPVGSGVESGTETEALPAIWERRAEFDRRAQALVDASAALQTASASGDLPGVRTASAAVGAACKSCHTDFRAKK